MQRAQFTFLLGTKGEIKYAFQKEKFLLRVTSMTRQRKPAHHMLAHAELNLLYLFLPCDPL